MCIRDSHELIRQRIDQRNFAAWERLGTVVDEETPSELYARVRIAMIEAERERVLEIRSAGTVASDVVAEVLAMLDIEESEARELYDSPLHPYTRALMSAVPVPDPVIEDQREQILLTGDLPSPSNPPTGCRFHTRCPWRQETRCDEERPELRVVEIDGVTPGHRVACHWVEQIASGEIQPHEVNAELIEEHQRATDDEIPFFPDPGH